MGVSLTRTDRTRRHHVQLMEITAGFDTSYTAGGESVAPGVPHVTADIDELRAVFIKPPAINSGYVVQYEHDSDDAGGQLVVYEPDGSGGLAEVSGGTDLSAVSVELRAWGR